MIRDIIGGDRIIMDYYNIGKVAKVYHLNADTLRHYEELGLISPRRAPNGYRLFDTEDLCNIDVICDLRKLDFSLEEIGKYLHNRSMESTLSLLNEELKIVRNQMASLRKLEMQIFSRINNLTDLFYRITDVCSVVNLPDRYCRRYSLSTDNDADYFIAAREIMDTIPDSQYLIGNVNLGREIDIIKNDGGELSTRFKSVILIDEYGDVELKGGSYITLVFKGGSKMVTAKLRDIEQYAKENGYEFDGDPILLILTDSHEVSDSSKWVDELQVRVRKV